MLELTEAAADVLLRAHEAATRFNPDARVRLYLSRGEVQTALADAPEDSDSVVTVSGIDVFVEKDLEGTLDVASPHDRLVLR